MHEKTWVDSLVPPDGGLSQVIDSLGHRRITDCGDVVDLGPADQATLALLSCAMRVPAHNLLIELPRGQHDIAILCGLFIQLVRLVGAKKASGLPRRAVPSPVVVIGTNTMAQQRLSEIRIDNVPLSEGLGAYRVRSDGELVATRGSRATVRDQPKALLYLNTRVGWPKLDAATRASSVVIDRTSFSSTDILRKALQWAKEHKAKSIVVVSDLGDEFAREILAAELDEFLTWPWSPGAVKELVWELGIRPVGSPLSTNAICREEFEPVHIIQCQAAAVDLAFRRAMFGLREARRFGGDWPRPLQLAQRLVYGLVQLVTTVDEYNAWAALDHRASALSSVRARLENSGTSDFGDAWSVFEQTRWAEIRHDVFALYDLIKADNPKLYGLAYALQLLNEKYPRDRVVIRVSGSAAAAALESSIYDLLPEQSSNRTFECRPFSDRLPWTTNDVTELYAAFPPRARLPSIWSGESTRRYLLLYPVETQYGTRVLEKMCATQRDMHRRASEVLNLGLPPTHDEGTDFDVAAEFDLDARPAVGSVPELEVDTDVLFSAQGDSKHLGSSESDESVRDVEARPIVLEPDGTEWWIREGAQVEVLMAGKILYLPLDDIKVGTTVVVPRGEARDELFSRLVSAIHKRDSLEAFEVFFRRWRAACWLAYERAGNWQELERLMREAGSTVTWQSPRTWATGNVIAPDDPEDIRRIGHIAGEPLVEHQYLRLAEMARQVRGLHSKLGRLLSSAMLEAVGEGGAHLDALTHLLGTDPSELLDEFELRSVRSVGPSRYVSTHHLRTITGPK